MMIAIFKNLNNILIFYQNIFSIQYFYISFNFKVKKVKKTK